MSAPLLPLLLATGSMLSTGVAWFLAGRIAKTVSPLVSTFLFQLIGIPFFILLFPFNTAPFAQVNIPGLLAVGCYETFIMLLLFRAMREGDLSVTLPIIDVYAIVTFALGIIFLHESFTLLKIVGVLIVFAGIVLLSTNVTLKNLGSVFSARRGVLPALLASLGTGVYFFWVTILVRTSGWFYTALVIRIAIAVTALAVLVIKKQVIKKTFVKLPWLWLIVGAALDVVAFSLYNAAVSIAETSYVTIITSTSSLVIVLLSVLILKEKLTRNQAIGVALAVGGLIILQFR